MQVPPRATTLFSSLADLHAACVDLPPSDDTARMAIATREAILTKPAGSLGRLEDLTAWLGAWQRRAVPRLDRVRIVIFAGNHGVVRQGVSPWPAGVTAQMVDNFSAGGAAINQLARVANATLTVMPMADLVPTEDLTQAPAMTASSFLHAVTTGYATVEEMDTDLLCLGEMGIGNTTAAAALAAALFGGTGRDWAGRGAGLDAAGVAHKATIVDRALAHHAACRDDPLMAAQALGGYEMAAILGAVLAARHRHIPVLLDGFVCSAAAAPLRRLHATGLAHTRLSHRSAEAAHHALASYMGLEPLLDLGLRLGEGSGAALAVPLLRAALACHTGMASFADAGVSGRT